MEAPPATASCSCLLVKDVSPEYSESDIANAFKIAVKIQPEVTKNVLPNSMSGKSNVLVNLPRNLPAGKLWHLYDMLG